VVSLGRNIGKLVKARRLSYGEVARGIGIEDAQPIWALVKRNSKKSEFAGRLATYFGVPVERLIADDFDIEEADTPAKQEPPPPIEEALAIKRLRNALPDWRRYVLGLAVIDNHDTQALLLKTMREAVPDSRVEQHITVAPHAAARAKEKVRK
jgi:transcriptional regulator with XRE-family HTH domain